MTESPRCFYNDCPRPAVRFAEVSSPWQPPMECRAYCEDCWQRFIVRHVSQWRYDPVSMDKYMVWEVMSS